jgi:hypothetical protein
VKTWTPAYPLAVMLAAALLCPAPSAWSQALPAHPDELEFEPIEYHPPDPAAHRVELSNGMVVFIAEDQTLPLIDVSLRMQVGGWLEPAGAD